MMGLAMIFPTCSRHSRVSHQYSSSLLMRSLIPSLTRETDLTSQSRTGLTGRIGKCKIFFKYICFFRHSSIFLTEDEKEGRDSDGDDDMPELPDEMESFQDEDIEETISNNNNNDSAKDEL